MRQPRRPVADWISRERKAHGWKVEELSRRLKEAGYLAEPSTISVWEAPRGRDPHPDTIEALERIFGSAAPREREPADMSALVAALTRQTDSTDALYRIMERQTLALEALAARMQEERDDAPAWAEAVVAAVRAGRQLSREATGLDGPQGSDAPLRRTR